MLLCSSGGESASLLPFDTFFFFLIELLVKKTGLGWSVLLARLLAMVAFPSFFFFSCQEIIVYYVLRSCSVATYVYTSSWYEERQVAGIYEERLPDVFFPLSACDDTLGISSQTIIPKGNLNLRTWYTLFSVWWLCEQRRACISLCRLMKDHNGHWVLLDVNGWK